MVQLLWDPDRYDEISAQPIFLISWCLYDHTVFAEVRVLSFLNACDLTRFCCTRYCIYLELGEISEAVVEYRYGFRNGR